MFSINTNINPRFFKYGIICISDIWGIRVDSDSIINSKTIIAYTSSKFLKQFVKLKYT